MQCLENKTIEQKTVNDRLLEQKLKPWERNYFHNLNNRMRGAQSVNAAESKSFAHFR